MRKKKGKSQFGMLVLFILVVFAAGLVNSGITTLAVYLLVDNGILTVADNVVPGMGRLMIFIAVLSIPVGLLIAVLASKFPLKPIRDLIESMDRLASGDFKTRMNVGAIMRNYPAFVSLCESFNKMAEQLENTEMLRADFVNNFSHEFKTPIVSITGFAKLLKRGNLTSEQKLDYVNAIEEESVRLSYMANNVLSLTRVENQAILSDVTEYNLSEQIRSCILLLEREWDSKNIDLQLEFGEHRIRACEELMKQVWINLLDNAIKFTSDGHTVRVRIWEQENKICVSVMNTGSEISPEHQKKIFNKFYQADESHATQGNGVGLAIVKRITQLHGGTVSVSSKNDVTTFTVTLPQ